MFGCYLSFSVLYAAGVFLFFLIDIYVLVEICDLENLKYPFTNYFVLEQNKLEMSRTGIIDN